MELSNIDGSNLPAGRQVPPSPQEKSLAIQLVIFLWRGRVRTLSEQRFCKITSINK